MTFDTPEEQLPMVTIQKRQGSIIRVSGFATTGQNLSMEQTETRGKDTLSVAFAQHMNRKDRYAPEEENIDCNLDYVNFGYPCPQSGV